LHPVGELVFGDLGGHHHDGGVTRFEQVLTWERNWSLTRAFAKFAHQGALQAAEREADERDEEQHFIRAAMFVGGSVGGRSGSRHVFAMSGWPIRPNPFRQG
jgi:hypothetical protein